MKPKTPHLPSILLAAFLALIGAGTAVAGEYIPDPEWNNGLHTQDAFAGLASESYIGRKMVRLANGDVIIAGQVPSKSGATAPTIGLLRRDSSGQRVAWANPGPNGYYSNEYVVIPGFADQHVVDVTDLVHHGDLLFVLANTNNGPNPNIFDASIYVFGTDGSYKGTTFAETVYSAGGRTVFGRGLTVYNTDLGSNSPVELLYVGSRKTTPSSVENIAFRRATVNVNTGTVIWSGGAIRPETIECPSDRHCSGQAIKIGGRINGLSGGRPRVYILGSRNRPCDSTPVVCAVNPYGWRAFVAELNPTASNAPLSNFRWGESETRGRALTVQPRIPNDYIWQIAERERACKSGTSVRGYLGGSTTPTWTTNFGGSDSTGITCISARTVLPRAASYSGSGRLGIAGMGYYTPPCGTPGSCPEDVVDGFAAVLDMLTGDLISPNSASSLPSPVYYPFRNSSGMRTRHSGFTSIVAGLSTSFTVAGDVRYPEDHANSSYRGKQQFTALRIVENTETEIFSDGFESSGSGNGGSPSQGLNAAGLSFFNKLFESQQTRTLVGHQATSIRGVGWEFWQCNNNCSDFYTSANNRHPAVVGWELESQGGDSSQTLDWETYATTMQEALKARNRGAINTFAMHLRRLDTPGNNQGSWQVQPAGHCDQLLPGGTFHADWNAKLNGFVTQLNTYQVNGQPVPFLFRPFHEADGNWFWWGSTGCSDTSFKNLFRYTVQYMRNAGLKHMLVVYAPGIFTTQAQYLARYPGDDVVDVIGFDQYLVGSLNPGHGTTVADLTNKLGIVHALAQSRGKIAAWAETGQQRLPSNDAFTQMAQAITNSGAKLAYIMFWANYTTSEFYVPYPSSPQALKTDFQNFLQPPRVTTGQYPSLYP